MPLNDDDFMRYSRHLLMGDIGELGQQRLSDARVLIVGLGGLGCPVALYLVAAGVGQIGLCDPDRVDKTNLQRQVLYRTDDCGSLKVGCAKQALEALNPGVTISAFARPIDKEILADGYHLVVDCTDNLAARQIINDACYAQRIPFVSAAAVGWEGQLVAFDFGRFRSLCFNCIIDHNSAEPMMNCANSGVVGPVLGIMGSMQATTVIRLLLGYFKQHGEMTRYDGKRGQWLSMHCSRNQQCPTCGAASV
ncbi:MAG: HesA/MoeB/ThiF family protein [Proteobacteria bacterium]|jgi:molybdopterin/thiamine biosynthesis adenylyltransferase|nr:HesA/MoeB/ThiF family protein [Pseudomonadota bacterium]MDA1352231.1 HesA/MoeB/ThiF family protein [Pseudomonadota bacterium]|tara:strand:- start:1855 stop:2604 length:750 start_codon:yes stop_codon:yes gene_type:complete